MDLIHPGTPEALPKRSLTLDTLKHWGVGVTDCRGKRTLVFNYKDTSGRIIAQKLRFPGKDFAFVGDTKQCGLFGQHLWRDKGTRVVVTEGEIDAMSVSQVQSNKWPVVSVPNGAQGAKKALQKNLEWLQGFDEVVLMFDNDEPGRQAAEECMTLFEPGRCKVAKLPLKDANEMLMEGRAKEIVDAIFGAKVLRPDGIVSGADLWDAVREEDTAFRIAYPWQKLQEMTEGSGFGEVIMWTAGSGIGKSAVTRELEFHLCGLSETIGIIRLEEDKRRSALGLMGLALNKPLHRRSLSEVDEADLRKAFDETIGSGRVFLYDHFGSTNIDNLLGKIRYLAKGCGCRVIFLDHISIVVSGEEDGDERRLIDNLMTGLKSLAMECDICIHAVSHLKRPAGQGHEEGARTSLAQLRGSHSIAQLSDFVIGMERNQQDEATKNITTLRILKNRFTGETGEAGWLIYDQDTGRLRETLEDPTIERHADGTGAHGSEDCPF